MPTFREDTKIGGMVPMMKTDDINDQAITKDKIRDGNVTAEKLADGAVSTEKLPDGAIKTPKIADGNITTSKLAEASVVTSKIADQNVTKEKIADQSVDNSKLSPEAVTYDKLKDKSVITEKLNDRAVTTEKVEEKAITNAKIGDSAVDGRVISEASVEKKHLANDSVATEKLQDSAITSDKIHIHAVTEEKIEDSAISNSKLADNSVGTSKIKDGNVTNEKVANNTITIDKFDPELRKSIQAATGLPENLVEVIQDVDVEVKSLHSKDEDLQSQIADKQQQITANDKDIEYLQNRSTQMEQSINNIAVTGGASVANTVTYSNTASGLVSINAQGAIDELAAKNATKAEKAEVTAELEKKFDKESILQESGDADDKVMSQKAVSDKLSDLNQDMYAVKVLSSSRTSTTNRNKFIPIADLCKNNKYFLEDGQGGLSERTDNGVTKTSDFLDASILYRVRTNGIRDSTGSLASVLYFSEKNKESYIKSEYVDESEGWNTFDKELTIPSNASYFIVQWNSNQYTQHGNNYGLFGIDKIINDLSDKLEKESQKISNVSEKVKLLNGIVSLKNKYRYIMTSFGYSEMELMVFGSNDLEHWFAENLNAYKPQLGRKTLRDPSPCAIGGYYYITYTVQDWGGGNTIGMCRTTDFIDFEELSQLTLKYNGSDIPITTVWAPAWFVDGFNNYIVVNCGFDGRKKTYYCKYDNINHTTTDLLLLKLPYGEDLQTIDTHIYVENGYYYAIYKQENGSESNIHIAKSKTLDGDFVEIESNLQEVTGHCEGQVAFRIDNGKVRLIYQFLGSGEYPIRYVDGANFEEKNWSVSKDISYNVKTDKHPSHPDGIDFCKFGVGYGTPNK